MSGAILDGGEYDGAFVQYTVETGPPRFSLGLNMTNTASNTRSFGMILGCWIPFAVLVVSALL